MPKLAVATLSILWAVSDASCILVADALSAQTLRIESWGHNAVRVRAVRVLAGVRTENAKPINSDVNRTCPGLVICNSDLSC